MFYLVAYGAATLGAFAVITLVRDPSGEATLLSSWVGLGQRLTGRRRWCSRCSCSASPASR